jgi:hypothetical protein
MFGLRPAFVVGGEQEVTVPPGEAWLIHSHTSLPSHLTPSSQCYVHQTIVLSLVAPKCALGSPQRAIVTTLVEFSN